MDFHTLSRKQLQTLCKKNRIPANITNVAMADALAALNQVEGLDEFLNPREVDAGTPDVRRASAQRKAVRGEAEGSKAKVSIRPQRGAKAGTAEVVEEENKDANAPVTPAASRRRATAVSTRRKKELEIVVVDDDDDDGDDYKNGVQGKPANVPKTPAAALSSRTRATGRSVCTKIETPSGNSVQTAYNTRRSVRLLEKNLSTMNLIDNEDMGLAKIDDASQELSDVSQQVEDSSHTDKGTSLQTVSAMVSENDNELEVSSLEQNTEYGCQSNDSGSDVKLVSETENDMGAGSQAEQQEDAGPQKVTYFEVEPDNANLKLEGICDSNETRSEVLPVLEESCDSCELETESKECVGAREDPFLVEASNDAFQDVSDHHIAALPVVVPDDVSVGVTDKDVAGSLPMTSVRDASVSLKEFVESNIDDQGLDEGDDNQDKNNESQEEGESHDSNLKLEGGCGVICDDSDETGSVVARLLEETSDSSEPEIENKECVGARQDVLPIKASSGAFMEVIDQDIADLTVVPDHDSMDAINQDIAVLTVVVPDVVSDQDAADTPPMSSVKDASVRLKEFIGCNIDDDDAGSDEGDDKKDKNNQTEFEPMYHVDKKAADEKELASSEGALELALSTFSSSDEHQEELLEEKPEESEESREETDKIDKVSDVFCSNFAAVVQLFPESPADGNESVEVKIVEAADHTNNSENVGDEAQVEENVNLESSLLNEEAVNSKNNSETLEAEAQTEENVILESSLLDLEAEDHKNNSENLEAEAQAEESKECAAREDSVLDADNAFPGVLHGPQIPLVLQQVPVESTGSHMDSCVLSYNSDKLVDGDVVPTDEQKTSDVTIQSVVSEQLKGDMNNADMMKENLTTDELHKMSVGELKRMLKRLTLDDKSNCKKTIDVVKVQEVKKRTALQALPQNKMTVGDARNDG